MQVVTRLLGPMLKTIAFTTFCALSPWSIDWRVYPARSDRPRSPVRLPLPKSASEPDHAVARGDQLPGGAAGLSLAKERKFWGRRFWAPGYLAVSQAPLPTRWSAATLTDGKASRPTAVDFQSTTAEPLGFQPRGSVIATGATIYLRVYGNSSCAGLGRPVPIAPTKFLLTTAVYRHVRNPMYIGVALVILGEAVMFCSPHVLSMPLRCC